MSGMRLVGLLMLGLGVLIVWEVLQGRKPLDHLQQLIDLFGHQHRSGQTAPGMIAGGATPGGALVAP